MAMYGTAIQRMTLGALFGSVLIGVLRGMGRGVVAACTRAG
jgi:hypothetical protein